VKVKSRKELKVFNPWGNNTHFSVVKSRKELKVVLETPFYILTFRVVKSRKELKGYKMERGIKRDHKRKILKGIEKLKIEY